MNVLRVFALLFALLGAFPALARPPAEPRPITIVVTNADDVARAREGAVIAGLASLFTDLDVAVADEVVAQMGPRLQARGVQAVLGRSTVTVTPETARGFYLWDATTQTLGPATVTEGSYTCVQVTITNPEAMVREQKGALALFAGKLLAVDLGGKVNETAAAVILQELAAEGVSAMVSF